MSNLNTGHGHVIPNPDGSKARCGGPNLCPVCAEELKRLNQAMRNLTEDDLKNWATGFLARLEESEVT